MPPPAIPDRHAVYYPRIHFRDVDWLKATLLAFGRVYRIVPFDHPLDRDDPEIRTISERHGAKDPLVYEVDPEWSGIENAQEHLNRALRAVDPAVLQRRFGLQATVDREAEVGRYEVHASKVNGLLFGNLSGLGLLWRADANDPASPWIRVHPDLGDAILSVSAIATARNKGADVVTDELALHSAVAAVDEDAVLDTLISPDPRVPSLDDSRTTAQLAHVVLSTRFELGEVSLADVAALVRDGKDLRRFRTHLQSFVARVPPELPQAEREQRLAELADEVVEEWRAFEKGLPSRLKKAFRDKAADAGSDLAKDVSSELVKSAFSAGLGGGLAMLAHAATVPVILSAVIPAAVPIALALTGTALAFRRNQQAASPYRYLSRIVKARGVELAVASSYRPGGSATI
jgi:hypothetical protein